MTKRILVLVAALLPMIAGLGAMPAQAAPPSGALMNPSPSGPGQNVTFDETLATAEITNPVNGGALGFDSGGTATLSGTASGDTQFIDPYYTTSPPNTAQSWTECSNTGNFVPIQPNPGGT